MTRSAALALPLARLLAEPPGSERTYSFDDISIDLADDLTLAEPLRGRLRVARTNRGVLTDGHFVAALRETCSRCLGPAVIPIELDIVEEALPAIDLASGQAVDRSTEPDAVRLTDHHELDLEPLLRDAVSLAEPIAPLCRADCPGLCIDCGERLGSDHRAHDLDAVDPRLAALRAFKVDAAPENE